MKITRHIFAALVFAACLMGAVLSSCTETVGPAADANAKATTTFSLRRYSLNEFGAPVGQPQYQEVGDTISATLQPAGKWFGRDTAYKFRLSRRYRYNSLLKQDSTYLHYLANGDVEVFHQDTLSGFILPGFWTALPLGSKGSKTVTAFDTSYTNGGQTWSVNETVTTSFGGPVAITSGTTKVNTLMVSEHRVLTVTNKTPVAMDDVYWYSPSMGIIAQYSHQVVGLSTPPAWWYGYGYTLMPTLTD